MIKRIKRIWLPYKLTEMAAWYASFALKFDEFYTVLGFTEDEMRAVRDDNACLQWLNNAMRVSEANISALKSFRDQTLYGARTDGSPTLPTMDLPPVPATHLTFAILQRLDLLREKIEMADRYTPDIGAQLGIIGPKRESAAVETVKPTLRVFAAERDYELAAVVGGRGRSDLNELEIRVPNQEKWTSLVRFTGKSANARHQPEPGGVPVKVELRVQLYRGNEKYGPPSDPIYVTLNP